MDLRLLHGEAAVYSLCVPRRTLDDNTNIKRYLSMSCTQPSEHTILRSHACLLSKNWIDNYWRANTKKARRVFIKVSYTYHAPSSALPRWSGRLLTKTSS